MTAWRGIRVTHRAQPRDAVAPSAVSAQRWVAARRIDAHARGGRRVAHAHAWRAHASSHTQAGAA
jgi:hypothetical protein